MTHGELQHTRINRKRISTAFERIALLAADADELVSESLGIAAIGTYEVNRIAELTREIDTKLSEIHADTLRLLRQVLEQENS